mgnify:CR=1 FL=1
MSKLNQRVEFPLRIDMKPYVHKGSSQENDNLVYELKSVIVHMGTPYGGHYEAFIWDNMYEKPWEPKEYTAEIP